MPRKKKSDSEIAPPEPQNGTDGTPPAAAKRSTAKTSSAKAKKSTRKTPAARQTKGAAKPATSVREPSDDEIRIRAYFIAERRHRLALPGDADSDWLEAKRQLLIEVQR